MASLKLPKLFSKKEKRIEEEEGASLKRKLAGWQMYAVAAIGIIMSVFHIWTLGFRSIPTHMLFVLHTGFAMVLGFCIYGVNKKQAGTGKIAWYDLAFVAVAIVTTALQCIYMNEMIPRLGVINNIMDSVIGFLVLIMVMELTRRTNGPVLPILCIIFLFYARFGNIFDGMLGHKGFTWQRIFSFMISEEALFGTPIQASARICFLFLVFSAFLMRSGAGNSFIDLAIGVAGRYRGGPAKVSIVSSSLFGTISGNSVANVLSTGTFTIPMMKRIGYKARFAGAVEAVASTGGQIVPPIMGAAAFILASTIGVPYARVMGAAVIPAVLYYIAVFLMVDLEAVRTGLKGLPSEEVPSVKRVIVEKWSHFIPILALIYCLTIANTSIIRAALIGIAAVILCTVFYKNDQNMITHPMNIVHGLKEGALGAVSIIVACACAGVITGVLSLTGTGLKFAGLVMSLSGGRLLVALALTMLVSLILGMGLPTAAAYIVTAAICAPALTQMGVSQLAAHMFCFYFACISAITPPVALAAYAGAQLAGDNPMRVGFTSCKLGIVAFVVPYMFVYGEELLGSGSFGDVALCIITSIIGVVALSICLEGVTFGCRKINIVERILFLGAAGCLIMPGIKTDIIGAVLIAAAIAMTRIFKTKPISSEAADMQSAADDVQNEQKKD
ncbi:MAG: TRAP transporter permease [Eubacteriales bacterium]|nr:TRAP transporter permease [Eubacteriales bacterium]